MNCIECRRLLLTDPKSTDPQLTAHLQSCEQCKQFASNLHSFELGLKQAVMVDVPEGMASRILLRQRMTEQKRPRRYQWLALAASLLITFTLVVTIGLGPSQQPTLEQAVFKHLHDELHHMHEKNNVSVSALNLILKPHGAKLKTNRTINYAGACPIRRYQGAHVVLDDKRGPVTVFIMPSEPVTQRTTINDEHFQGVIIPTANGSVAIVAEEPEQVRSVEQELKTQMQIIL